MQPSADPCSRLCHLMPLPQRHLGTKEGGLILLLLLLCVFNVEVSELVHTAFAACSSEFCVRDLWQRSGNEHEGDRLQQGNGDTHFASLLDAMTRNQSRT